MTRAMLAIIMGAAVAATAGDAAAVAPLGSLGALRGAADAEARAAEQAGVERQISQTYRAGVDQGIGLLNQGMGLYDSIRDFTESAEALNTDDLEFDPNYSPPGQPTIPVHCEVEGGAACQQCYQSAYRRLNFVRFYLEKLRGIYGATDKYTKNAIAFGDSMAGINGGFGLAWPPERHGIQQAFEKMGKTYDEKYEGYMRELLKGLREVDACEKQYFGQDDWYNRYGFIYYTYMQDRYRR
jgi:hypothetical protein